MTSLWGNARRAGAMGVALAAAFGSASLAMAAPAAVRTLDVVERAATDTVSLKGGSAADNVGDLLTFTNPIYDKANVTQVGVDHGFCVRLEVGKIIECHWTLSLAKGQIMVEGPVSDTGDTVLAVTGGTGIYNGVKGEMLIHARDAKASALYADAFGRDPQFAKFYRSLEAYRASFRSKSDVMVVDPSSEFFAAMRGGAGVSAQPAAAAAAHRR